jgi:hypothetical protein
MPGRFAAFRKRFAISKDEMIKADSKWTKLCTYTTAKKVKIVNAKVALFHKGMILAIIGYILANLVASFGYMKVEAPFGSTNAYISDSTWSTTQATLKANNPIYCGGGTSCSGTDCSDTNSTYDYTYSANYVYNTNYCEYDLDIGDVLTKGESAAFITTYYQDKPAAGAYVSLHGTEYTSANGVTSTFAESNNFNGLGAGNKATGNYFVPGIEEMYLNFDHTVTTSWDDTTTNAKMTFGSKTYAKGETVSIKIQDLLTEAGADLDSVNIGADPSGSTTGPYYRISGMHLKFEMEYSNMNRETPFNHDVHANAKVSYTTGTWNSLGPKIVYKQHTDKEVYRYQRYAYTLRISFVAKGSIGVFDWFTLFLNLAVALGLTGVAITVVDMVSEFFVDDFADKKYDDRNEWLTLQACMENAIETGMLKRYAAKRGIQILGDKKLERMQSGSG